jgi:hypothetical protein
MADRPRIAVFCEDRGHELFVRSLLERLAKEGGLEVVVTAVSARGGHARALLEFRVWQGAFLRQSAQGVPNLLVLLIDSNCDPWNEARREHEAAIDEAVIPRYVVGCPDPHVERWYIADPTAFERVVGAPPGSDREKCEHHFYKRLVEDAAERAGAPLLTGPADLAPDLVESMDLYRAGKNQPSLGHFIDDLRGALRLLKEVQSHSTP